MFYAQSTGTVTSGRRCVENAELPKALRLKPGECLPAAKFSQLYFSVSEPSILFQRKNGVMTASPTCTFNLMICQTFAVDYLGGKYRVANWAGALMYVLPTRERGEGRFLRKSPPLMMMMMS